MSPILRTFAIVSLTGITSVGFGGAALAQPVNSDETPYSAAVSPEQNLAEASLSSLPFGRQVGTLPQTASDAVDPDNAKTGAAESSQTPALAQEAFALSTGLGFAEQRAAPVGNAFASGSHRDAASRSYRLSKTTHDFDTNGPLNAVKVDIARRGQFTTDTRTANQEGARRPYRVAEEALKLQVDHILEPHEEQGKYALVRFKL